MAENFVTVDLFSGLGGFSESMLQRGWEVVRIDNDEQFSDIPNTTIDDVMTLDPRDLPQRPDILLISPPCECFSLMTADHYWRQCKPSTDKSRHAVALVKRALWIKDKIKPRYWLLENPNGMMVHVLGKPNHRTWWAAWYSDKDLILEKLKPDLPPLKFTSLWGLAPSITWPSRPQEGYQKVKRGENKGIRDRRLTPPERSLIPFNFSEALAVSIEEDRGGQTQL